MRTEHRITKQGQAIKSFAEQARVRVRRRTIEVPSVSKRDLHKVEAVWMERVFKPHGWITLEIGKKKNEDELRAIIKAYLCKVAKIHKQHIHALVRFGVQANSNEKNKLHFHILYRFEHKVVCTRAMELVWKRQIRKILRKDNKASVSDRLDEVELGVIIDCGIDRHLYKSEKDFYAHAYPYESVKTIEYTLDPKKQPDEWYLVGCPKYLLSCRRGKCEHHRKKHLMVNS